MDIVAVIVHCETMRKDANMPSWNVHFDLAADMSAPHRLERLVAAKSLARTIRDIPVPPHVQSRLHTLNIVRAVRGTTGIEGTELSEDEVNRVLAAPADQPVLEAARRREEREVRNAQALKTLVENTLRRNPDTPLSESLIREFHRVLTDGIDYPNNEPGRYRTRRVTAGDYLAPDYAEVPALMSGFADWLNRGRGAALDPIVKAIVAHFLLVSVHPFGDGNGRTSRGAESFLLYKAGVNSRGFYSLANYYYRNRSDYVALLNHVRFVSDPDAAPFVDFALKGLVEELEQVHSEILSEVRVIAFRDYARERLQMEGRLGLHTGNRQLLFLLELGGQEIAASDLRSGRHPIAHLYRGVGQRTVTRDLNLLTRLDLIKVERGVIRANIGVMDEFAASDARPLAESRR